MVPILIVACLWITLGVSGVRDWMEREASSFVMFVIRSSEDMSKEGREDSPCIERSWKKRETGKKEKLEKREVGKKRNWKKRETGK